MENTQQFRSRIKEKAQKRAGDLLVHPRNTKDMANTDHQDRVKAILKKFGIVSDLLAYHSERNDGGLTLLNGHVRQAIDPNQIWEVSVLDINDSEADELLLYLDPSTAQATHVEEKLKALIFSVSPSDEALQSLIQGSLSSAGIQASLAELLVMTDTENLPDTIPIIQHVTGYEDQKGGELSPPDDKDPQEIIYTDVRQVQLFFKEETRQEFSQLVKELADQMGLGTTSDTVMEVIRYAHKNLVG